MRPTALEIMEAVAEAYGVTLDDLRSRNRMARLADARAVACYLLTRRLNMSSRYIGTMMSRNHATVLHSVRKVESMFRWPTMYAVDLNIIKSIEDKYFNKSNIKPNETDDTNTTKSEAMDAVGG